MYLNQPTNDWMDLTLNDIIATTDIRKRIEYRKKCEFCLQKVIRPIYMEMKKIKGFDFSAPEKELTCRVMLNELQESFDDLNEFFRKVKEVSYVSN